MKPFLHSITGFFIYKGLFRTLFLGGLFLFMAAEGWGQPIDFEVTGGGSYCESGVGLQVGLSGSEIGVTYTLYKNTIAQVPTVEGTGTPINFGIHLFGTYTVSGTNGSETTIMTGSAVITNNLLPTAPTVGTITQPTCGVSTGSVELSGLPTGIWTLNPGSISGSGSTYTVTLLTAGQTYNYTVTNGDGCISTASGDVVIAAQPITPTAPTVGTITQPTCGVSTGSVELSGLPTGIWTLNPGSISGSGSTYTVTLLTAGQTYNYTVTNGDGCISTASGDVVIAAQPITPTAPTVGTITQPTCGVSTGSVELSGLPTGSWTLNPGSISGSGSTYTVTLLTAGQTYNYTVTNGDGCISTASGDVVIAAQPITPTAPTVGTITQPTCGVSTGSVELSGLPTGSWTLNPGSISGSGSTYTVTLLTAGQTYNYTVTNGDGCISTASGDVVIAAQPITPTAPTVGTITQPTCGVSTGSVELSGLPTGIWTLNPGSISGSGSTYTVTLLTAGQTYNYTVTNGDGCISTASGDVVIAAQPITPTAPTVGTITQPTCGVSTGSVELSGLPTGSWTLNPGSISGSGSTYTVTLLTAGQTYNYTVTNGDGCISTASGDVVIAAQPITPTAPTVGTITQPTCGVSTGSVELSGLPTGSWTLNPGSISGSGSTYTVTLLTAGQTYNYTVTNGDGCISTASGDVVIAAQPITPTAPTVGTITQPTCGVSTGSVELSGLPTGIWTLNPGSISGSGSTYTVTLLTAGQTYNYTVTNGDGCISTASGDVVIAAQPITPTAPTVGTITQPTCGVSTGSVELSGLPTGIWTLNPGSISGSGSTYTVTLLTAGQTYNYTVTNGDGCISTASGDVVIAAQPITPTAPTVGTITQPTCGVSTGSVELSGLPTGIWTLNPGSISGSGSTYTVTLLTAGQTYNYTVTNGDGCISTASGDVVIAAQPITPTAPTVGTITQPTCGVSTGSVELSGLPTGIWTLNPGSISGSGSTYTVTLLTAGQTYNYTVTNGDGCISTASGDVVIAAQPITPTAPTVGTITQPTCGVSTGSVELSGLPTGSWTLNPGSISGSGSTYTVTLLTAGQTYNYTVTNGDGCISTASGDVVIAAQPITPTAPTVGTITQPTCGVSTGSVELSGLPTGSWTLNPGSISGSGSTYTVTLLTAGQTYNYTVTNGDGCISTASGDVVIAAQPITPIVSITNPTAVCSPATGTRLPHQ